MGKMHTKAERTEKVEEIKAENRKKIKKENSYLSVSK